MEVGQLVTGAKGSAGLSVRRLAGKGHVASSTITRIQSGAVDPTVQMLERILNAAGFELQIGAVRSGTPRRARLADLTDAWSRRKDTVRLEWPLWRAFLDDLALYPDRTPEAIYVAPPPAGEPIVDALLAAIAEKLADDAGLPRPEWTQGVPALDQAYRPPVARAVAERRIPSQFAARGLMIDTMSFWRDRESVGA